ncbi:MAG: diaminopimelate epimerase [Deltaproteobacteria bacterium]|nr:diaminopimelate epimerase [Deltaproteobacteria bacterium]
MSGSGNDFIIIDNRNLSLNVGDMQTFVRKVCLRKLSVGADGLILIEPSSRSDFKWQFFNADGSSGEMCGNGGRCAARYAFYKGIAGQKMSFETIAGIISAYVDNDVVKIKLTDPSPMNSGEKIAVDDRIFILDSIDTGVPHAVAFVDDLPSFAVAEWGRKIRFHEHFAPKGTNADFAAVLDGHKIQLRTYERGVEDETLACGTGMAAAVLAAAQRGLVESPVDVLVQSGETLRIYYSRKDNLWKDVYLEGRVKMVCQGFLFEEAYR